ncbi:MAG: hypothetical protein KAI83_02100 [Thiomargarita sp.]|nr:hypothetical protein [Thiomargarita sp.]
MNAIFKKRFPALKTKGLTSRKRWRNHLAQSVMVGGFAFLYNALSVTWATPYPEAGIDQTSSLGSFSVRLTKEYGIKWLAIDTCPGNLNNPNDPCVIHSPTLQDINTKIGRSQRHEDGDNADGEGAFIPCRDESVEIFGCPRTGEFPDFFPTPVMDSDFTLLPHLGLFTEGPLGTEEVHTQILSLNMTEHKACSGPQSATAIRVGFAGILTEPFEITPRSIGEVESKNAKEETRVFDEDKDMFDLDAEGFFNVFMYIDLDLDVNQEVDTTLFNIAPLVIQQNDLTRFPLTAVYIHGGNDFHPMVYDKYSGDQVGWLTFAGHGIGYSCLEQKELRKELGKEAKFIKDEAEFVKDYAIAYDRMSKATKGKTSKLEPYWKILLNVPNPTATDLGILYITNTSLDATISHIYGTMYSKGTLLVENKDLLKVGDSLKPLETMRFTSADLSNVVGQTWGGRALMKIGCSASDTGCSPDVLNVMMTGRKIGGGPLIDLTPEVPEKREDEKGIFTLLGIPPNGGEDVLNIRINNISTSSITVEIIMYNGYGKKNIGTKQISIEQNNFVRLTSTDLPGSWANESAWLQIVTNAPSGVTKVQYFMRDKTTGILSNLSVGGQQ